MNDAMAAPRCALLAGATGLVGHALLPLLLASERYRRVCVVLRRAAKDMPQSPKLKVLRVDFARLPAAFPAVDDVFIALGTTIRAAGSEAAFRRVDFDFVLNTARAARAAGATRLGVVSAMGANAKSRVFYSRVKGEVEAALARLGYESVVIAQPSLLLGNRAALGQPVRIGERWATGVLGGIGWVLPGNLRPIAADAVASALLEAILAGKPGVAVLKSRSMQGRDGRLPVRSRAASR
jgi:uncharacterized protein YbjT (DUF2867 family)